MMLLRPPSTEFRLRSGGSAGRRVLVATAAAALVFWCAGLEAQVPKKYALLIGINNYLHLGEGITPLNFAVNDVEALEEKLEDNEFEVVLLTNDEAVRSRIVQELYRYAEIVEPQDTFVLFFAGHGVRNIAVNDETYWLTYNARLTPLDESGIRLAHLLDFVRDIPAEKKLLLLDHCHSGEVQRASGSGPGGIRDGTGDARTLTGGDRGTFRPNQFKLELGSNASGMVILAAAREGAQESPDLRTFDRRGIERPGHGLFSYTLLQALGTSQADASIGGEAPDGSLTMSELSAYLRVKIPAFAQEHGLGDQQLTEVVPDGVNTSSWVLIPSLPIDDAQERAAATDAYGEKLQTWESQGLIDFETRIDCVRVLRLWKEALADGPPLTETDVKILDEVRKHLDSEAPEDILADDLMAQILRIRNG